ncbi:MAG: ATP-binding protein [Chloroflexota bacterium]
MTPTLHTTIALQADLEQLRGAGQALRALLEQAAAPEDTLGACELAVQELLTNIVNHACHGEASQVIRVELTVEGGPGGAALTVRTWDNGTPAELDLDNIAMPDPLALQVGGYGLALMHALVDRLEYTRQGAQNCWVLVKSFTPLQSQARS